MDRYDKVASLLNDLIRINNDRIVGYEKAIEELKTGDSDLVTLFQRYNSESRQYITELNHEVTRLGGEPAQRAGGGRRRDSLHAHRRGRE